MVARAPHEKAEAAEPARLQPGEYIYEDEDSQLPSRNCYRSTASHFVVIPQLCRQVEMLALRLLS